MNRQHTNTNIEKCCTWIYFTFIFHPSENLLPEQRNNRAFHLKHIKDWRWFQCSLTLNSIYLPFRFSISFLVFKLLEIRDLRIQWINQLIEAQPHEMNELKTQWEWMSWMKKKEKETNETKNNQKIIENKTNAYRFQNELHSQCLHGPTSVVNRKRTHALADHFVRAKVT